MNLGVVEFANSKLGLNYQWGGTSDSTGYDCSGLTMKAYESAGITIPRTAAEQYQSATLIDRNNLQAGDLVFFTTDDSNPTRISHVGIYNGDGTFTHAPNSDTPIKIESLDSAYYSTRFVSGGRYGSSGAGVGSTVFGSGGVTSGGVSSSGASSGGVSSGGVDVGPTVFGSSDSKSLFGKILSIVAMLVIAVLSVYFFMQAFEIKIF